MVRTIHPGKQVAHLWANRSQESAKQSNGQFYFEGDTIYSYGSHFPIARHLPSADAVLFTTRSRSNTTAKHKSYVLRALSGLAVFHVNDVQASSLPAHNRNLDEMRERMEGLVAKSKRSRKYAGFHIREAQSVVLQANKYAEIFGIDFRLSLPDEIVDEMERKAQEWEAKDRETQAKRDAAKLVSMQAQAEKWKAGETDSLGWEYPKTLLRIRGSRIETSRGAIVEIAEAQKILPSIRQCREKGLNYTPSIGEDSPIMVGDFALRFIGKDGNIQVGCHSIGYDEIERIAEILGL